jgi:signal transduction histidine kinase
VALAVRDHGRGIDPGDLGSIFEEFSRGRLAEDDGGTGLGLASVRELVEEQRGSVRIESELGVGTTVTVELPGPRRS